MGEYAGLKFPATSVRCSDVAGVVCPARHGIGNWIELADRLIAKAGQLWLASFQFLWPQCNSRQIQPGGWPQAFSNGQETADRLPFAVAIGTSGAAGTPAMRQATIRPVAGRTPVITQR